MSKKSVVAFSILATALIPFFGCASAPKTSSAVVDSVSVVLLSDKELKQKFGYDYGVNPFLAPDGMILKKNYDYIVAKLDVGTVQGAKLEINRAEVVDKNGKIRAYFYDRETFADYAQKNSQTDQAGIRRVNVVNWWYLPSNSFTLKPGKHEYILVFMGKHPVPDSLEAQIDLSVNNQEQEVDLPVPDQNQ